MIIGIDGNEANQKIRVGSGVYAYNLLWQIYRQTQNSKLKTQNYNLKFKIYLKNQPIKELPSEDNNWQYKTVRPNKLWTQLGLPIELWKEKMIGIAPDVFFTPSHYAPRFCPIPSVITIFDLSFLRFPEMFLPKDLYQLKSWTVYSVKQAKKIITISENSKSDIIKYYGIAKEKIVVAYPGYNKEKYQISKVKDQKYILKIKNKYKIKGDYILYVGTIQPRKNLKRLLEAFKRLKTQNLKLVLAGMIKEGRGGWMSDEIIHQAQSDIIITGYIPENDLPYLMMGARAFVLPSLYEGFGIPVIEAMACGIPVVVSNVSSLPEIVGKAGVLIDPYDVSDIEARLFKVCTDNKERENLVRLGLERVKLFGWERCAQIILNTLKTIAN